MSSHDGRARGIRKDGASFRLRPTLGLLALTLFFSALLAVYRWLPDPGLLAVIAPTIESLLLLVLVGLAATFLQRPRASYVIAAVIAAVLVLFGIGEGFYQSIFRREFVPWTDLAFVSPLLTMVFHSSLFERPAVILTLLAAVVAAVTALIYAIARGTGSAVRSAGPAGAAAVGVVLVLLFAAQSVTGYVERTAGPAQREAPPILLVRALRQVTPPATEALARETGSRPANTGSGTQRYAFPLLRDRDIHFFVVESYGHTVMSNPSHRELMMPAYRELSSRLRNDGYWSYSGFLVSPAFGGRSWLADATMLTGIFLDTQHRYDTVISSGSRNLTHILGDAGYHRVLAAPGTYEAGEEWRSFYAFDQYLFRYDFDYAGPFVSFGAMPDQFLIKRANELAVAGRQPLFLKYVLVSSHVPFDRVPTYVENWEDLGNGSIFNDLPIRRFENNWLSGGEYPEGYVTSIRYTLTSIVDYLGMQDGSSLIVVVGDHQPRIPIAEPDSTFSVPIHVLSRDRSLVEPFRHYGFVRGFTPDSWLSRNTAEHASMDRLLSMLLDVARGITPAYEHLER